MDCRRLQTDMDEDDGRTVKSLIDFKVRLSFLFHLVFILGITAIPRTTVRVMKSTHHVRVFKLHFSFDSVRGGKNNNNKKTSNRN